MKQYNPFDFLLDSYNVECKNLFAVVRSVCDFPKMQIDENEYSNDFGTNNKLYATAFAYICHDYLVMLDEMYPHEGFGSISDSMNFEENEEFIFEIAKSLTIDFDNQLIQKQKQTNSIDDGINEYNELVYQIIQQYRARIASALKLVFKSEALLLAFFSSIFSMDETSDFEPSVPLYDYVNSSKFLY